MAMMPRRVRLGVYLLPIAPILTVFAFAAEGTAPIHFAGRSLLATVALCCFATVVAVFHRHDCDLDKVAGGLTAVVAVVAMVVLHSLCLAQGLGGGRCL